MQWNIRDYGAVPGGGLCTAQIQRTIDDCFLQGGGEVIIPAGRFLTGGIRLRSNVTLHLQKNAVLLGSIDPEDYCGYVNDPIEPISEEERNSVVSTSISTSRSVMPHSRWNNAIIRAIHAKNISIIGEEGAEINGQNCYDPIGEEDYRGPHAINMWFCQQVTLRGYTIRDSANWAHAIQNSRDITVREIVVLGGHDGFDVRTCDNILIEKCRFLTGDDCIAGFDNSGVTVRECYFESSCSIFRFGGTDVLIENCTGIAPATYGFRGSLSPEEKQARADTTKDCRHNCHNVFLYYCDNRAFIRKTPGNILIRNCQFRNPDSVMRLPFGHKWTCNRSLEDITFQNCVIEGVNLPIQITAPEAEPLTFHMRDCLVSPREGFAEIPFMEGKNVKKVVLSNVSLDAFRDPKILCDQTTQIVTE